jgi:Xaa-Pro aminopeptidase
VRRRRRTPRRLLPDGGERPTDGDGTADDDRPTDGDGTADDDRPTDGGGAAGAPGPSRVLDAVAAAVAEADAAGFVHVGDRFDPDLRALVGFDGPDRGYAVVHDAGGGGWTCLAPSLYDGDAERAFPGTVRPADGRPPGERAAALLGERRSDAAAGREDGRVLVPPHLPHDAAVYLEDAGFALASTGAVRDARAAKSQAEVDAVRRAQAAAVAGVERAAAVLRAADVPDGRGASGSRTAAGEDRADADATAGEGGVLALDGEPLTTVRLRRAVDAAVAAAGADPAANTVVAAGPACADLHYRGDRPVHAGETVLVDVSPREPGGYHGDCTRTFVVAGSGGWERRAHVACEAALRAGVAAVEPGAPARRVHEEVAAELAAYGFAAEYGADAGFTHAAGHGVGLALHEAPSLRGSGDESLREGATLAVEPGVYDPERGGVRVEDVVVVRAGGAEVLVETPRSLAP